MSRPSMFSADDRARQLDQADLYLGTDGTDLHLLLEDFPRRTPAHLRLNIRADDLIRAPEVDLRHAVDAKRLGQLAAVVGVVAD